MRLQDNLCAALYHCQRVEKSLGRLVVWVLTCQLPLMRALSGFPMRVRVRERRTLARRFVNVDNPWRQTEGMVVVVATVVVG